MLSAVAPVHAVTIEQVTSPGGIHAWLVEDHTTKVISLDYAIRGGTASDPEGQAGLSTFAMALLDEGAGPYDSGQYQGRLADLSAAVSFDAGVDSLTGSIETLSSTRDEVFELARLALTEPRFDAPAVERIRAEIDQMIDQQEQNPNGLAQHLLLAAELPGHPYGRWSTGTHDSVRKLTVEDLRRFVKTRLGRDRLIVSAVGDIGKDELGALLDHVFGGLPATTTQAVTPTDVKPAIGGKTILEKKPNPQSVMQFAEAGLAIHDPDFFSLMVLNRILGGGGLTSRLAKEVREKRGLAYHISTGLVNFDHADLILGTVATQNARLTETLDVIRQEWAKMRTDGPTDAEVADAKAYLNGAYTVGLTSSGAVSGRLLGLQLEHLGADYFTERPKKIDAVTTEDVRRVAAKLLDPAALVFAVVGDPANLKPDEIIGGTK